MVDQDETPQSEAQREFVHAPAVLHPAQYVLHQPWYYPGVIGGSALLFGLLFACSGSVWGLITLALVGTLTGVVMTLVATAWGVVIVFADNTRSGLWFVLFPPYMAVYAVRRWQWMAQPTVLFLCGVALAVASLWSAQRQVQLLSSPESVAPLSDQPAR